MPGTVKFDRHARSASVSPSSAGETERGSNRRSDTKLLGKLWSSGAQRPVPISNSGRHRRDRRCIEERSGRRVAWWWCCWCCSWAVEIIVYSSLLITFLCLWRTVRSDITALQSLFHRSQLSPSNIPWFAREPTVAGLNKPLSSCGWETVQSPAHWDQLVKGSRLIILRHPNHTGHTICLLSVSVASFLLCHSVTSSNKLTIALPRSWSLYFRLVPPSLTPGPIQQKLERK